METSRLDVSFFCFVGFLLSSFLFVGFVMPVGFSSFSFLLQFISHA